MAPDDLDDLNMRVTGAIFRAEHAALGSLIAEAAYREVSTLEEEIARQVGADEIEGALARVGAVTAALRAGDWLRAAQLAEAFSSDAPADLRDQLAGLAAEADAQSRAVAEPDVLPIVFDLRAA
jgi:hypothetical protein